MSVALVAIASDEARNGRAGPLQRHNDIRGVGLTASRLDSFTSRSTPSGSNSG